MCDHEELARIIQFVNTYKLNSICEQKVLYKAAVHSVCHELVIQLLGLYEAPFDSMAPTFDLGTLFETYIDKLDHYAMMARTRNSRRLFSAMSEVAHDIYTTM